MKIILNLPDDVAVRAQEAGLLTGPAVQELLESALRRDAGSRLISMAERIHAAGIPPISEDALDELIHELRANKRETHTPVLATKPGSF